MVILLITDTHGSMSYPGRWDVLAAQKPDVVFCMGDIYKDELQGIKNTFTVPIYGIPGNHEPMSCLEDAGIPNIHGKVVCERGISFAGFGGCPRYKDDPELCMMSDEESVEFAKSLEPAQILISHSPFRRSSSSESHRGFTGVSWYIQNKCPAIHFYGHLHENTREIEFLTKGETICLSQGIYRAALFDTKTLSTTHLF